MKKKLISVFSVMALVLGTYTVAMADNTTNSNATGNSLKSFGNVVYTNGEDSVEIYSDDLYILADQLDSFKSKVADQLAEINTYLSSGSNGTSTVTDSSIKIVHTEPSGSDVVDPLTLDFDTLLEGVAASQSIPTDVTEYGYSDGTILYKNSEGELTTDGTEENVEQINISAATPENLSAGSAAWVNGELILGTGADNKAYYNWGYINGFNKNEKNVEITYTYHEHTDDCYSSQPCTVTRVVTNNTGTRVYFTETHSSCGRGIVTSATSSSNLHDAVGTIYIDTHTYETLTCGKTESTIESAVILFN